MTLLLSLQQLLFLVDRILFPVTLNVVFLAKYLLSTINITELSCVPHSTYLGIYWVNMERLANSWLSFFQLHYYTVLVNYISSLNYTQLKQLWRCLVSITKGIYKHDILTMICHHLPPPPTNAHTVNTFGVIYICVMYPVYEECLQINYVCFFIG